ncbi:DUF6726 family protein [Arcobacter sp. LA11]|uniref:DUF6726 family protein n=1 Tax=Arcobacter sp. LA11 TaxID=1898176 RepID=UPI0009321732|nr:DUF6726 family protein [Arcobacter sp. LA11]
MKSFFLIFLIIVLFNGCIVGDVAALPFRVTGAVLNTVTPDIVGDSVSEVGETIDTAIPF